MYGNVDPRYLGWKYWLPRADWEGSRSFVVTSGSELIAHAGVVPGAWVYESRRVKVLHMIDWAARAGSGAGVTLLKHIGRMSEALLGIGGGAETRSILPHVGFRPAGAATGYARPLFPLRVLRGGVTWKWLPRVSRAAWRRSAPPAVPANWEARRISGDELGQIAAVLPRPGNGLAVMERSLGVFQHMLSCPALTMQLYALANAGRVRGYFLLASVSGQVRIADCWMDSDDPADWRALALCAVEKARHDPEGAEVVAWASDPLLAGALRSCGFYARFESPIHLRPSAHDALPEATLRVQMLDNDSAFLCLRRYEYWG